MIHLATLSVERFGALTTLKLVLMLAVIVGCLGAAAFTGPTTTLLHATP